MLNYQKQIISAINELIDLKIKDGQNYDNLANLHSNILKASLTIKQRKTHNTPASQTKHHQQALRAQIYN